jgi:tetratricopeptide (TPR) repeat protein
MEYTMKSTIGILIGLLMLTACKTTTESQIKQAEKYRQMGEAFYLENNYTGAMREYRAAQQITPDDPVLHNDIGLVYMDKGRYPEAMEAYTRALEIKPDYGDALLNMSVVYLRMGKYDQAISRLQELEKSMLYGTPQDVWLNLAYAYFQKNEFDIAATYYQKVINHFEDGFAKNRTYIRALAGMARIHLRQGNPRAALVLLDTALTDAPDHPALHYYRATALAMSNDMKAARKAYLKVIELDPKSEWSQKSVAALKQMGG